MSQDAAPAALPAKEAVPENEQKKQDEPAEGQERQREEAWAAMRALIAHGPEFVRPLATAVAGDQYGVSGGTVLGNVNYYGGRSPEGPSILSGEIERDRVHKLSEVFCGCPSFDDALGRLRAGRIVILSGGRGTGRRSAAMMLLSRLDIEHLRSLDEPDSVSSLSEQLDSTAGYLLLNLPISRRKPLREPQLLSLREQLERTGGYLVITVEPSAALGDVQYVRWEPPSTSELLRSHILPGAGEMAWTALSGLTSVKEFLARPQQPRGIEEFARHLLRYHRGEIDEESLAGLGDAAVERQVEQMIADRGRTLRDKAFLISLAVFDKAPYAVAAELSDPLYVGLQKTDDPQRRPAVPLFDVSREERLLLSGATGYVDTEVTEWGNVVGQFFARYQDERVAPALLHEIWHCRPSARPALVEWIENLADDGRPLVRTRAAATAAQLAAIDLSSTMALLIEPWADDDYFGSWLTAANALTMAHLLNVPHVLNILRDWCAGDAPGRRWTAVRAYGLLGPVRHEETLSALLDAIHQRSTSDRDRGRDTDAEEDKEEAEEREEEATQFADALELLLLAVREPVLHRLAERLPGDRQLHGLALQAFRQACAQTSDDGNERPFVLDWYARAAAAGDTGTTSELAAFWAALLAEREHTPAALGILRTWIRGADADPVSESALATLLPALTAVRTSHRRVCHLLRTARTPGGLPSPAAQRLLAHL